MKYLSMLLVLFSVIFLSCEKEYLNVTGLNETEEARLLYLVEEEKLAFDLYTLAYDTYGTPLFSNIADAEVRHREKLMQLVHDFGVDDPDFPAAPGLYRSVELRVLYESLSEQVLKSEIDALRAGILIEETDMADLKAARFETDEPRLERVYGNLQEASHRHLRAFQVQLDYLLNG